MPKIFGLVLAGGSGVRLWPRSREELPKQFLSICGGRTMLQETVLRMLNIVEPQDLYAVAGGKWEALVSFQASEVMLASHDFVIKEPAARNTAPAILLGCEFLRGKGAADDDIVVVTPSDHIVNDAVAFKSALQKAIAAASAGYMTILGIPPSHPDVGFGYVKRGPDRGDWYEVANFVEKPDLKTAEQYLQSGDYFWNGGVFIFTLGTFYRELEHTAPDLFKKAQHGAKELSDNFKSLPSISFDYAVMEKADKVAMVRLEAGWSDVGSWDALHEVLDKDVFNNAVIGDVILQDTKNCLVDSRIRLTAMVDVEDLIVIDSPDALFIAKRGSSQKVRSVVDRLKASVRKEALEATESARPWGTYRVLCEDYRFKIKRIVITPGKHLSMQYHYHRSEHWVVVRGTALVTLNGEQKFVHEGESIFIPKNAPHRLENPGKVELEIIEVQRGEYLGEDDIVRLDDDFDRTSNA